ncbi:unnamed protein product [Allacma fusca]|uniref:CRAL-TRIO domain-containing protein n=1 Tax=Allacma fusca TaxID=39272 RepID=A0A8J2NUL5_9HEXA|nr:unnamed protein product [Allacma fusca]
MDPTTEMSPREVEAVQEYTKWREENQVDDVQEAKVPIHFYEDFPAKICGLDKEGYLVVAAQVGKWDIRSAVDTGMKDEFIWFVIQWIERATDICAQLTTEEKFYSAVSLILDLAGLQYRQVASKAFISMVIELVTVFEANYPEFLRCIWIINAAAEKLLGVVYGTGIPDEPLFCPELLTVCARPDFNNGMY